MSSTAPTPDLPSHYAERAQTEGDHTWLEDAIEDWLGLTITQPQREICRSVAKNPRTFVVTANGLGKSYILAAITIVWLAVRYPAVSFATSGTERKMKRTYCKPVENLHGNARIPIPGQYKSRPERIEIEGEPEHFFEAASPRDAGELEGIHGAFTLSIIEEADKDDVDEEVLDAMKSLVTDERDRIIAIANPPKDETNSIYPILDDADDPDSKWNVLEFSSFESHNVRVERDEIEGEMIDGLATVYKIQDDWEDYNNEEWPGIAQAERWTDPEHPEFREDLDGRWYRRRGGIMPPESAGKHRPFHVADVKDAFDREPQTVTATPQGIGLDVARGTGDYNALCAVFGDELRVLDYWHGVDHNENNETVRDEIGNSWTTGFAIDAIGEGSGLADMIDTWYPNRIRYYAGGNPARFREYDDCWAESMHLLGQFLENGGTIADSRLREEMLTAARCVEYSEKYISKYDTEVLDLTSKEEVKDRLERSPDLLDAAAQAIWAADDKTGQGGQNVPATW